MTTTKVEHLAGPAELLLPPNGSLIAGEWIGGEQTFSVSSVTVPDRSRFTGSRPRRYSSRNRGTSRWGTLLPM